MKCRGLRAKLILGDLRPLAFSPDGELLACGRDRLAVVRTADLAAATADVANRLVFNTVGPAGPRPPAGEVRAVAVLAGPPGFAAAAFSADGRHLLAACDTPTVRVWETAGWAERPGYTFKAGKLGGLAVSPDGLRAAAAARGKVVVWDVD